MENPRFKFRVWDKVSKRYFYLELKFGDNGYHPDFITDPVFEQCTGLKDKNGNLIYEGDIIQNHDKDQYVVEWCIDGYWYIRQADDEKFGCALASLKTLYDGWEIIGNIHEQAEQKDVK